MTTIMFLGMTLCLPLAYWLDKKQKRQQQQQDIEEPLLSQRGDNDDTTAAATPSPRNNKGGIKEILLLSIPTFFDLIATILMNIGLLSVTASVYQMMRGAEMIFAALFAVVFLKRTLNKMHFLGLACCIAGIALVGSASLFSGEGSASHEIPTSKIAIGMALVVASQAVQAAQVTFEDYFMADLYIPPLKIVGYEGLFGSIAMVGVMLPLVQWLPGQDGQGVHEDTLDTLTMIRSTPVLMILLLTDMAALLAYNVSGMLVTGHLGAVFRTVLETTRTLAVWLVDLLLFYVGAGGGKLGERWTEWSLIQAAGFVVLVSGTVIYSKGDEREAKEVLAHRLHANVEGEEGALLLNGRGEEEDGDVDYREGGGGGSVISGISSSQGGHPGAISIARNASLAIPVAVGSMKSTMNMNAFSFTGGGVSVGSMTVLNNRRTSNTRLLSP
jgi:drug/metabolite transporter (DMT)-like permease